MAFQKKKSFGQHFLHEKKIIQKIIHALIPATTIVEIGPGEGALTNELIKLAYKKYILAEADATLFDMLEKKFPQASLVKGDAAKADFKKQIEDDWICVGNLPYNAAAPIMTHVLREMPRPRQCLFMIQKEQADRVCAEPGGMSMLSLAAQLYGKPQRLFTVAPGCFTPPPKVDSAVIEIIPFQDADKEENEAVLHFAKRAFQHRRKQIRKTLGDTPEQKEIIQNTLNDMELQADARPQMLSAQNWRILYKKFQNEM